MVKKQAKRMMPESKMLVNKLLWAVFEINQKRGYQASLSYSKKVIEINAIGGGTYFSAFVKPMDSRAELQLKNALKELTQITNP